MADPLGIDDKAPPLTFVQWLICFTAAMGFAFDIYALLMLPLIVRPALLEMAGFAPGTPAFNAWVGRLFYIPAFAGGISSPTTRRQTTHGTRKKNIGVFRERRWR